MLQHIQPRQDGAARKARNLHVGLATCETEILEAQKLRYRVFADEMGARLATRTPGVDRDIYDPFCEHLIVRDEDAGRIVGTYRILSPAAARKVGGYYSENEFDLTRLQHLRGRMVEIGRSCIDADYRSGAVIALLWSGLARYMQENGYDYLIGCASVSMADGGHTAASLYNRLREKHLAPLEYHVFPRYPLPIGSLRSDLETEAPPLIKGYLRAGAWICGEPAWDPDFNTADLPILLSINKVDERYARHFMGRQN
ncbi:GNAT family N-acetyltransferase [Thauera sp.]|jgi:putative hemolysin|uniref:GNAT family N-acetyltransferase n=1 Tax=Thauera sp. TaxID=1905334 RepID=UPI002A368138|nr:GNAT family N-acyltransferase [Thauera sp.]MDX9886025.1 GNAT family N-acyltransferase [Thauera sp.]